MKVLQIIESAYRATLEEQDDTIIWVTHAIKGAGGDLDVLLRGNAVMYGAAGQDASGLWIGDWEMESPPQIANDVGGLIGKGVRVHYVQEDAAERGLKKADMIAGLTPIKRTGIASVMGDYDQVWHW